MIAALLDLDGTLVDTNYQHAIAWFRAFRDHGVVLPIWRLHRHIGMGGDQLVAAVAGEQADREIGDAVRRDHGRHFHALIGEVTLMPDARRLIEVLHHRGAAVVLASSAAEADLKHFRKMLDVDDLLAGATSSADVESSKPAPDLIHAALKKVPQAGRSVMVGDSTWDCEAARRAGAAAVFESIGELLDQIERTPLG